LVFIPIGSCENHGPPTVSAFDTLLVTSILEGVRRYIAVYSAMVSFVDAGFDVSVLVRNEADHPARDVHITILGRSMRHLTCQYVDPPECYAEGPPRSACAQLGDIESGGIRSVLFHFMAARAGELDLTAHVSAANLEGVEKLPIEGEIVP